MLLTLLQTTGFELPSLTVWVLAWILLSLGLVALIVLVLYTKYGREFSIKLSVISIIISSAFIGFSIHFFLLSFSL